MTEPQSRVQRALDTAEPWKVAPIPHPRVKRVRLVKSEREVRHIAVRLDAKIPVSLPPAPKRIRRRVRCHMICCSVGGVLTVIALHVMPDVVPIVPVLPSLAQEAVDRILRQ